MTSQKILIDNSEIFFTSPVSIYNQIKAITKTKGTETSIPPQNELCLLISEMATISTEDNNTFIM